MGSAAVMCGLLQSFPLDGGEVQVLLSLTAREAPIPAFARGDG